MKVSTSSGVTSPKGFLASGVASGIKRRGLDLTLIASDREASAAGVLTTHKLAAAPVHLTRATLKSGRAHAIVANSGNANCCNGPSGMRDALSIRKNTASLLKLKATSVLVASTGVIGQKLPIQGTLKALPSLVRKLSSSGSNQAARGILTTDKVTKSASTSFKLKGQAIRIGGIAKGSGMIDPTMATMLCFLTTDAAINPARLKQALRAANQKTFNQITVDGQMSTNDTVLILANGAAGNKALQPGKPGWSTFCEALEAVMSQLARAIVQDGEGATRYLTVEVHSAKTEAQAQQAAKAIANAPLVKTMVRGEDPNWGRVAATVGALPIAVSPGKLEIALSGITVYRRGGPVSVARAELNKRFRKKEVSISVSLHQGTGEAQVYTCDLTEGYVRINAKYS